MRAIDSDHVIARLDEIQPFAGNKAANAAINLAKDVVRNAPTLSPDDLRPVGKWIWHDNYGWDNTLECSCCAEEYVVYDGEFPGVDSFKYCPNCGAKMEVSDE
jgi:hypothetical protein